MKNVFIILAILVNGIAFPQPAQINKTSDNNPVEKYEFQFDNKALRIPGESFPIGIKTYYKNGEVAQTKGFLNGKDKWAKYKVEVNEGRFSNSKLKIAKSETYKKFDSLEVKVYTRTHFLGRRNIWLLTEKIPYNYETDIHIVTAGQYSKSPGSHIKYGIRTDFDNGMSQFSWPDKPCFNLRLLLGNEEASFTLPKTKLFDGFNIIPDGGYVLHDEFVINNNPVQIKKHTVKLTALLAKKQDIADTLKIVLDYIDHFKFELPVLRGFSGNDGDPGHNLDVFTDVFYDTTINAELMYVNIKDLWNDKIYHYLINTNGGTIKIVSRGQDGGGGINGRNGHNGANGATGTWYSRIVQINDSTTITISEQGPGGDGQNGGNGECGGDGGDGGNGGDIYINFTSYAEPYLNMIDAISLPGYGGSGGSGGSGGMGGAGGQGNPTGRSGLNGSSGFSGSSSRHGYEGRIYLSKIEDE